MTSHRKLVLISVLTGILFIVAIVFILLVSNNNAVESARRDVHVSVRPVGTSPITIYETASNSLVITSLSPEIDIVLDSSVKELLIQAPTYKDQRVLVSDIMTVILEKKDMIEPGEQIIESISGEKAFIEKNGYLIKNPKYYDGGKWLYGLLVTTTVATDGEKIVIKIINNQDTVIFAGTDIDIDSLVESGVPENTARQIAQDAADE
jgi:hypothetical protein